MFVTDIRTQILNNARELFITEGYAKTSPQSIAKKTEVPLATFHTHFESKQSVLEALIEHLVEDMKHVVQPIVTHPSMGAIDKLNLIFAAGMEVFSEQMEDVWAFTEVIFGGDNYQLIHKTALMSSQLQVPALKAIIKQGIQTSVFDLKLDNVVIDTTAKFIAQIVYSMDTDLIHSLLDSDRADDAVENIYTGYENAQQAIERILGIPSGSVQIVERKVLERFYA